MLTPTHCLIVEDHENAQIWMRDALRMAFPGVDILCASSLVQARTMLDPSPQLVLLDLGLPDGKGSELIAELIAIDAEVIIATVFSDDEHLFQALQAGAKGYLLKDHPKEELVEMLQGVLNGRPPLSPSIATKLLHHFSTSTQSLKPQNTPEDNLTTRERDVLTLLAKGYTVKNVSELLDISYYTAAGYAKSVYRKLNVSTRAEATMEANRRGYVA